MTTSFHAPASANPAGSPLATGVIECRNPATGEHLGDVPAATPQQVQEAIARARTAQKAWARSSFAQRRAVLGHILDHVLEHAEELVGYIVRDSGKTHENAMLGEIMTVCNKLRWTMRNGEKYLKPERVGPGILPHKKARIEYIPLGVVACIIPWNYPLQNIISSLVSPLMAGNAVIVKPSEAVAWSSLRFERILHEALQKEGFSKDTVQIINGYGDAGAALVRGGVQKILFIGSVPNGRRIIEGSAEHLTPVIMELGGKDPLIVCDDAHLEKAVHSALGGTFINLGQNCVASERILVQAGIHDRFLAEVTREAAALRQGVPTRPGQLDVGAITTPMQLAVIDGLVKDALARGAKAVVGGEVRRIGEGTFYPPTILTGVTPDMPIAYTEVFGPIMLIMKFSTDEEAIRIANSTEFGLHSSVITQNPERGEKIAAQLDAGATCINDFGLCYVNQNLPFGGVKYSGFGVMNGREGLRAYTTPKAVLSDRFRMEVPPKLYPVKPGDFEQALATIRLMFGRTAAQKWQGLAALIRGLVRGNR
jgi:acyl-CoA reductase-like NAD-dependent aldehyde dehydrogenase